jgi:hypothetical protein
MRKILWALILLFLIMTLVNFRFGCSNSSTPEVTDKKSETIYSGSLATDPSYWFISYTLYDDNRLCYPWRGESFVAYTKDRDTISREDVCEHCKKAWKWHYNK